MASFFKSNKRKVKTPVNVVEKQRFFKQFKNLKPQESINLFSREIFLDKIFWTLFSVWFIPIILVGSYVLLNLESLPNQIPLFYSRAWGEGQLAQAKFIFLPIFGAFILGIVNFITAAIFHPKNKVFSYLLMGAGSLISILAAITTFNIVNLMH